MKKKTLILVTNDDGFTATGVRKLMEWLSPYGEVIGVCPDGPRSAQSMAITVNTALRINRVEDYSGPGKLFKVNGTPVDCVKLAMHTVMERKPDLVVAGINHGSNAAINVIYSGTMGATLEGCAFGIPSIGFSLTDHNPHADFSPVKPFIGPIVEPVLRNGLPDGICLNVNVPHDKGIPDEMRVVRACRGKWTDEYEKYIDPFGRPFYWLKGEFINEEPDATDTDEWCLAHGIVSVVPVLLDATAPLDSDLVNRIING